MKEAGYLHSKEQTFRDCGLKPSDKKHSCHHIQLRRDHSRLPREFNLNDKRNLVPLPIDTHTELHKLIDETPCFMDNLNTRVYLANMAFIGELDLVPERIYLKDPMDIMRK